MLGRFVRRGLVVAFVFALVAGIATLGVPIRFAGAATPAITVSPDTGLAPGASVSVSGTGLPAGELGVLQCTAGLTDVRDCDLSGLLQILTPAADGSFSTTLTVERAIRTAAQGTVSCAGAGTCAVVAASVADQSIRAVHPITFDPTVPVPAPVVSVMPDEGLVHGQVVTVTGSGFRPASDLVVMQCGASVPCDPTGVDLTTDASGGFTTWYPVRSRITDVGTPRDCREGGCLLAVVDFNDAEYDVTRPLEFDPAGPLPPNPAVTVTPDTDLVDRQVVDVAGTGFDAEVPLFVSQCPAGPGSCFAQVPQVAFTDANGAFSYELRVRRVIHATFPAEGTIDCATDDCEIDVVQGDAAQLAAAAPVAFDPAVPPAPPPTVTAAPTAGLPYRQTVTITGTGFSPGATAIVSVCAQGPDSGFCSGEQTAPADAAGALSHAVIVRRIVANVDVPIDCVDPASSCEIQVSSDDLLETVVFPLTFDPDAPVPPPPAVTVDPATDLGFRQPVTVRASGFAPGDEVTVAQCLPGGGPFTGTCAFLQPATTDASGNVEAVVTARRTLSNGFDLPTDCATAPGTCVMLVASLAGGESGSAPLAFDPDAPVPPPPVVTTTPAAGLENGDTVAVTGSGFTPNANLGFTLCAEGTQSLNRCDVPGAVFVTADADGSFRGEITVRSSITTAEGTIDCTTVPGVCAVGAANLSDFTENGRAPLSFGPEIATGTVTRETARVTVPVSLSRPAPGEVRVHWSTADGTAVAGEDYVAGAGDLVFAPGETERTVTVELLRAEWRDDEEFFVELSAPSGGSVATTGSRATVVVPATRDDDHHHHHHHHHGHGHHHHGHHHDRGHRHGDHDDGHDRGRHGGHWDARHRS